jgi:ankyrin repeat protein
MYGHRDLQRRIITACIFIGLLLVPFVVYQSPEWISQAAGVPVGDQRLLHEATLGDAQGIRDALNAGAPVNTRDECGYTALDCAVMSDNFPAVKALVDAGADLNVSTETGMTALGIAISDRRRDLVGLLLKGGASPNPIRSTDVSPLYLAALSGQAEMVQRLIDAGADVNMTCRDGLTPLLGAVCAYDNEAQITRLLIGAGARVNEPNLEGATPLMEAAQRGQVETVLILLRAGADPIRRNHAGDSARMIAQRCGNWRVAELLSHAENRQQA